MSVFDLEKGTAAMSNRNVLGNPPAVGNDSDASLKDAALFWRRFGFRPIPILPGTLTPAHTDGVWSETPSIEQIDEYWSAHADHEVGFRLPSNVVVLSTDWGGGVEVLRVTEGRFNIEPN